MIREWLRRWRFRRRERQIILRQLRDGVDGGSILMAGAARFEAEFPDDPVTLQRKATGELMLRRLRGQRLDA